MKYDKVVIIGVGLIGGSIGKALIEKGLAREVVGVCRRATSLEKALGEKAITSGYVDDLKKAVAGADLAVIATPVEKIKEIIEELAAAAQGDNLLVTDAGSTKKEIVDFARNAAAGIRFVGSHPLAGSEKSGVRYSDAGLFEGSVCVVTPDDGSGRSAAVEDFWRALGARVVIMPPEDHDRCLSFSSHLPHIAAYALVASLGEGFPADMLSSGFRDTTRIASSDADLWAEIFISNRDNLMSAVAEYREQISRIERHIEAGDHVSLRGLLEKIKKDRDDIFRKD